MERICVLHVKNVNNRESSWLTKTKLSFVGDLEHCYQRPVRTKTWFKITNARGMQEQYYAY